MAKKGRLVEARFTSPDASMIRCVFKDYSRPDPDNYTIEMHSYDPESKFIKDVLAQFPLHELEARYAEFNKAEEESMRLFNEFSKHPEEIMDYINSGISPTVVEEKPLNLASIMAISDAPEDFFKLKLEIFELPEVKASKDRKWKASMRKATTTLELLALLHAAGSPSDSELS